MVPSYKCPEGNQRGGHVVKVEPIVEVVFAEQFRFREVRHHVLLRFPLLQ